MFWQDFARAILKSLNDDKLKQFLQRWLINTVSVLVASTMVHGISYDGWTNLLIATLVLGILNAVLRPILWLLSAPFILFTLGLFLLVINAAMLMLVSWLMQPHFMVSGFKAAFWGGVVIWIVSMVLNTLTGTGNSRVSVNVNRGAPKPPPRRDGDDGGGPVIDV
jgi:putative membrane protein